ncbi:hypothetical protein BE17_53010 [Sorangium cellulosum]|uniref:Uncharacterized protein n=1 Tax=Sorangium cellulosum TaxID=56 RepID=A0A150RWK4_SORCE|nr:hypothetical protein BE17_53010 [Sorangium cellulosum]
MRIEELDRPSDEAQACDAGRIDDVAKLSVGGLSVEVDEVLDARRTRDVHEIGAVAGEGAGVDRDTVDCGERSVQRPIQGERDLHSGGVIAKSNRAGRALGKIDRGAALPRAAARSRELRSKGAAMQALEAGAYGGAQRLVEPDTDCRKAVARARNLG